MKPGTSNGYPAAISDVSVYLSRWLVLPFRLKTLRVKLCTARQFRLTSSVKFEKSPSANASSNKLNLFSPWSFKLPPCVAYRSSATLNRVSCFHLISFVGTNLATSLFSPKIFPGKPNELKQNDWKLNYFSILRYKQIKSPVINKPDLPAKIGLLPSSHTLVPTQHRLVVKAEVNQPRSG